MKEYIININGDRYHGYYRCMSDAVFGAMRKRDKTINRQIYTELAILVTETGSAVTRRTTGCTLIK